MSDKEMDVLEEVQKEEFTEEEVAKGMLETATNKRIVEVAGLGKVELRHPSRQDEMEADNERSKAFTRFLLEGLKTEAEMKRIVEERGIWTQEDEELLIKAQQDMVSLRIDIAQNKGTKKKGLQKKLLDARANWLETFARKNAIFSHTVDNKAENVWWQFLTHRCAFKEDGTLVWKTYEDFLKEANTNPSAILLTEFMTFYHGLSENFFALWAGEETGLPKSGE